MFANNITRRVPARTDRLRRLVSIRQSQGSGFGPIASLASVAEAKREGDISDAFVSLSSVLKDAEPLDDKYRLLKQKLLAQGREKSQLLPNNGHQHFHKAWSQLLKAIQDKAAVVEQQGTSYIPTLDFDDIKRSAYSWHDLEHANLDSSRIKRLKDFSEAYKERGVAVIRNVVPTQEVQALKQDLQRYIEVNSDNVKGYPAGPGKQVYEIYWSKAQLIARAHRQMMLTQQYLLSFWHAKQPGASEDTEIVGGLPKIAAMPVTYADRLRMRQPGDGTFALGPHVDGGSVERWEHAGYGLGDNGKGTYANVFAGNWQQHDPWFWPGRSEAETDLSRGVGACSMFRAAQGWLALSDIDAGEGHLRVNPILLESLAYWLVRPFFEPKLRVDETDLDSYLDVGNWQLEENLTSKVHGAMPGFGQEINEVLHPHLRLDKTMIHMPKVQPGDLVVWHCDTIHAVDPKHTGNSDSSVLYIPICPWTEENVKYSLRQLQAFRDGSPAPDFGGGVGERDFIGRIKIDDTKDVIGDAGRWSMGISDSTLSSQDEKAMELYSEILEKAARAGTIDQSKW